MWTFLTKVFGWAKSIPSEPNGNGSTSRVIGLAMAFALIGLMVGFLILTHTLPTPEQFYGMTALLGAACSAYVTNKLSSIGKPPSGPPGQEGQ